MDSKKALRVTTDVIEDLAKGLAAEAKIGIDEAHRVLKVLHVEKLDENIQAYHSVMSNPSMVNALGISHAHARENLKVADVGMVTVANLRMAIKPISAASIAV